MTEVKTSMKAKPKRTYVVMKARIGGSHYWTWGLVTTGPGFDEVFYTETDGYTPANIDEAPSNLEHLFTVVVND